MNAVMSAFQEWRAEMKPEEKIEGMKSKNRATNRQSINALNLYMKKSSRCGSTTVVCVSEEEERYMPALRD